MASALRRAPGRQWWSWRSASYDSNTTPCCVSENAISASPPASRHSCRWSCWCGLRSLQTSDLPGRNLHSTCTARPLGRKIPFMSQLTLRPGTQVPRTFIIGVATFSTHAAPNARRRPTTTSSKSAPVRWDRRARMAGDVVIGHLPAGSRGHVRPWIRNRHSDAEDRCMARSLPLPRSLR